MIVLDANVWIAFFNVEDAQHTRAQKIIDGIGNQKIILPEYIFLEVVTVLRLRTNEDLTQKFVTYALSNVDIDVLLSDEQLFHDTTKVFAQCAKISFADASLVVLSQFYTVKTFDRVLARCITKAMS